MNRLTRTVLGVLALSLLPLSALRAQQTLTLTNGDRLTGQLTNVAAGAWIFKHAGGEVKIPASSVAAFTAADPIGLRLADHTVLAGTVAPAGDQLQVTLADGTTTSFPPADLAAVGDPADLEALEFVPIGYFTPFTRFWGATLSLGFSDKSGNSRSRGLSGAVEFGRTSPKDRLTIKAGANREDSRAESGDFETTVEKYYGSVRADVFFTSRFFVFGFMGHERDTFQDIDLRSNYNGGLGLQLITADETDLRVYASGGARIENFTSGGSNSTPVAGTGMGLRQVLGPAVLAWSVDWSPSIEDIEDYRLLSEAALTTAVLKGLGFRVALRNEYNNSPQPGIEKHDMLITTALTYTIGR